MKVKSNVSELTAAFNMRQMIGLTYLFHSVLNGNELLGILGIRTGFFY